MHFSLEFWLFLSVMATLFVAEFADKTMLVTIMLIRKYTVRQVLTGIIPACFAVSFVGVGVTHLAKGHMPQFWLSMTAAALFIALGFWSLHEMNEGDDVEIESPWMKKFGPSGISFITFSIAEMADRTQWATVTLSSGEGSFMLYWFATSLGLLLANVGAIIVMMRLKKAIPRRLLMYVAGIGFFAFGGYTIPKTLGWTGVAWTTAITICIIGVIPATYRYFSRPSATEAATV